MILRKLTHMRVNLTPNKFNNTKIAAKNVITIILYRILDKIIPTHSNFSCTKVFN